jgi:hypothetical protein
MLPFKMFGFSVGVGEVALVALPALLALPAVLAVGTAAGFVVPGFPAIAPCPPVHPSKRRSEAIRSVLPSIKRSVRSRDNALLNPPPLGS